MTEQKISDIDEQIKQLLKLKEMKIKENAAVTHYDSAVEGQSFGMKILNCPDILAYEYLLKKYNPDNLLNSKAELVFMKALESKNLIFASSLFFSDHMKRLFCLSDDHFSCGDFHERILTLAMKHNDFDRLKMLLNVMMMKYANGKRYKYAPELTFQKSKLTVYEVEKYDIALTIDQKNYIDLTNTNSNEYHNLKAYQNKLIAQLIKNTPSVLLNKTLEFILEKNLLYSGKQYELTINIDIHGVIQNTTMHNYDKCDSLELCDIISNIPNNFNKALMEYLADGLNNKNTETLYLFKQYVKLNPYHNINGIIIYSLNKIGDIEWREKVMGLFDLKSNDINMYMYPYSWMGINLKTVSIELFAYFVDLIKASNSKRAELEHIYGCDIQNNNMILYLEKIERNDLIEYMFDTFQTKSVSSVSSHATKPVAAYKKKSADK